MERTRFRGTLGLSVSIVTAEQVNRYSPYAHDSPSIADVLVQILKPRFRAGTHHDGISRPSQCLVWPQPRARPNQACLEIRPFLAGSGGIQQDVGVLLVPFLLPQQVTLPSQIDTDDAGTEDTPRHGARQVADGAGHARDDDDAAGCDAGGSQRRQRGRSGAERGAEGCWIGRCRRTHNPVWQRHQARRRHRGVFLERARDVFRRVELARAGCGQPAETVGTGAARRAEIAYADRSTDERGVVRLDDLSDAFVACDVVVFREPGLGSDGEASILSNVNYAFSYERVRTHATAKARVEYLDHSFRRSRRPDWDFAH